MSRPSGKGIIAIARSLHGAKFPPVTDHSGTFPESVTGQLVGLDGRPLIKDLKEKGTQSQGHALFDLFAEQAFTGELAQGVHVQHVINLQGSQHLYLYLKEHDVEPATAESMFSRHETSLDFFTGINGFTGTGSFTDPDIKKALEWNASKEFRGQTLALKDAHMASHEELLRKTLREGGNINDIPTVGFLGPNFVHFTNQHAIVDPANGKFVHKMTPITDWHHAMVGAAHQGVIYNAARPGKYSVLVFGYGGGLSPWADYGNNKMARYIWSVAGAKLPYLIQHRLEGSKLPFKVWLHLRNPQLSWESWWMDIGANALGDVGVAANMPFHDSQTLERLDKPRLLELTKDNIAEFNEISKKQDLVELYEYASKAPEATGEFREGGLWEGKTKISITDAITNATSYQSSTLAQGSEEASSHVLEKIKQHLEVELSPRRLKEKIEAIQKESLRVLAESGRTFASIEEATIFARSSEGVQLMLEAVYKEAINKYTPQIIDGVLSKNFTLTDGASPDASMVRDFIKLATQEVYVAPMVIPGGDGEILVRDVATDFVVEKISGTPSSKTAFEQAVIHAEQRTAEARVVVELRRKELKEAEDKAEEKKEIEKKKREVERAELERARADKENKEKKDTKERLERSKEERRKDKEERREHFEKKLKERLTGTKKK